LKLDAQILEGSFRGLQCKFRVERFLLDLRIAQFQDDRVRFDLGTGTQQNPLDAAISRGREPPGVLGDERAKAANLPNGAAGSIRARAMDTAMTTMTPTAA
jgi:hypothetical protein